MTPSLSVIVPAYNEERNLADTVAAVRREIAPNFPDYEVIVVDDGSTDSTPAVADGLAAADPRVRALHQANRGLGGAYFRGVSDARKDYVLMVPGDNEVCLEGMRGMWPLVGTVDMVLSYTSNPEVRPWRRRAWTRFGTWGMNLLYGVDLRYFNGCSVQRAALLRTIRVENDGFLYQAELLVRLLRKGATYAEVGIPIRLRPSGKSKVMRPRNVWSVLSTIVRLSWTTRFGRNS